MEEIFEMVGIECKNINELEGLIIEREKFLCDEKYGLIKKMIPDLRKNYSSSFMTSLQENAKERQKWPVLNLIRQILLAHKLDMTPIRKADGYTKEGKKLYKRYFKIERII